MESGKQSLPKLERQITFADKVEVAEVTSRDARSPLRTDKEETPPKSQVHRVTFLKSNHLRSKIQHKLFRIEFY